MLNSKNFRVCDQVTGHKQHEFIRIYFRNSSFTLELNATLKAVCEKGYQVQ